MPGSKLSRSVFNFSWYPGAIVNVHIPADDAKPTLLPRNAKYIVERQYPSPKLRLAANNSRYEMLSTIERRKQTVANKLHAHV